MKRKAGIVTITILCLLAGFMILLQVHTQEYYSSDLNHQKTSDLVAIVNESNEKRHELEKQHQSTAQTLATLEAQSLTEAELLTQLEQEQASLLIANNTTAVRGPGISITFEDDSALLSNDLVAILNELWGTGAEAIAINDVRVTNKSSFSTTVKNHDVRLTVDGKALEVPITIRAIGNSDNLETGVTFPGGILDNLKSLFGTAPMIIKEAEITLPAASQ